MPRESKWTVQRTTARLRTVTAATSDPDSPAEQAMLRSLAAARIDPPVVQSLSPPPASPVSTAGWLGIED